MVYELRNKCYNFCTNIIKDGNKDQGFYEHEICDLLNKQEKEIELLKQDISFADRMGSMQERQIERQRKQLEKIYNLIEKHDWDMLIALHMDTCQDYEEIV